MNVSSPNARLPLTLVVMAAGMSRRYGLLKQLEPVGPSGETILDYSMYDARHAGFSHAVFVIRPETEKRFLEFLGTRKDCLPFSFAYQTLDRFVSTSYVSAHRTKPWGTAHALLCAKDNVSGAFGVINADDFYGREAFQKMAAFLHNTQKSGKTTCAMMGYRLRNTLSPNGPVSRGICLCDKHKQLLSIEERLHVEKGNTGIAYRDKDTLHPLSGEELVSLNFWAFDSSIFGPLEKGFQTFLQESGHEPKAEYFLPNVVNRLVKDHTVQVEVLSSDEQWFGLTHPNDKEEVQKRLAMLIAKNVYPATFR